MVMSNSPSSTGFTQNLAQELAQALLLEQVRFTKQQLLQPENKNYIRNFISQSYRHADQILLKDFIQLEQARGLPLTEAVLQAGAVRFRPIALTAAAVVLGGAVMVLDPIFQGLAVALISGAIVATALTMVVVPLLYWQLKREKTHV